ncbi:MAG: DUF1588 domain-containing protein [Myxococcota bacterium]
MRWLLTTLLTSALLAGCEGSIFSEARGPGGAAGGRTTAPDGPPPLAPVEVRRLSTFEFNNAVAALLGVADAGAGLPPDERQSGFSRNVEQRVDALFAERLQALAEQLGDSVAAARPASVVPCTATTAACRDQFIDRFATRAYRRPVTADERAELTAVFTAVAAEGTFADGLSAVIATVLQSASFLYVPALGEPGAAGARRELTRWEIASALSFFLTASPPDDELLRAAGAGELSRADARATQARRLLQTAAGKAQVTRFVRQWLGLETINRKSDAAFDTLTPLYTAETAAFVEEVLYRDDGTLSTLLTAEYGVGPDALATTYGATKLAAGRWSLAGTGRKGLLSQGSFLVAHAAPDHSGPVRRGLSVLRDVMCMSLAPPTGDVAVAAMVIPPVSSSQTTRQRFAAHSTNAACAGCHKVIDPIGFSFEHFDVMGRFRATENGQPVDATGTLVGTDIDGQVDGAAGLAERLASSANVQRCFAVKAARFTAGKSDATREEALLHAWEALPPAQQPKLLDVLEAYAASDFFAVREVTE